MAIKCVIFDVGGVLLKEKIDKVHDSLNKEFNRKIFDRKDALHRKSLKGKISEKDFFNILSKKHGIPARKLKAISDRRYLDIMKTDKKVINIAKKLQKNYTTCILSNVTPQHKRPDHVMKLYTYFDHRVLSCDIGAIKPQARIFRTALDILKLKPEECVFIEDREEFLITPKNLGIKTIHFKNAKQLKADLKKFGIAL